MGWWAVGCWPLAVGYGKKHRCCELGQDGFEVLRALSRALKMPSGTVPFCFEGTVCNANLVLFEGRGAS